MVRNQIYRNDFVFIHYHFCDISTEIIECKIFTLDELSITLYRIVLYSARNSDVLMNGQSPHKWWSSLKSAVLIRLVFVTAAACWWRWLTGVRVGWQSWSALGWFWWQAVQGVCWSATHLPSVCESYLLCLQVEWGHASLVRIEPLWGLRPIWYVSSFS